MFWLCVSRSDFDRFNTIITGTHFQIPPLNGHLCKIWVFCGDHVVSFKLWSLSVRLAVQISARTITTNLKVTLEFIGGKLKQGHLVVRAVTFANMKWFENNLDQMFPIIRQCAERNLKGQGLTIEVIGLISFGRTVTSWSMKRGGNNLAYGFTIMRWFGERNSPFDMSGL